MGDEPYLHDVVLNRLDTYLTYGEDKVFFSRSAFVNTDSWRNIPVIFAQEVTDGKLHPDFSEVQLGSLPAGQRYVGRVVKAYIPEAGSARLMGTLEITDPNIQPLAKAGLLGISTGFLSFKEPETDAEGNELGTFRMTGQIQPNHVLVFVQGDTPESYGRDNAAMFVNTIDGNVGDSTMTDSEIKEELTGIKKLIQTVHDKFCNTVEAAPAPQAAAVVEPEVKPAEPTLEAPKEEAEAEAPSDVAEAVEAQSKQELEDKIKALEAQLADIAHEREMEAKDSAWLKIKAKVPEGWLGEHEAETRELFESNKDAFYEKLMTHQAEFTNTVAEGVKTAVSAEAVSPEDAIRNNIRDVSAKTGYTFRI